MSKDYTAEIVALQAARTALQVSEKTIAAEVKARYRDIARKEIETRIADNKIDFARKLKVAHEAGVPSSLLRSDVLRTNSWDRWIYWRDLAEIEPDRVTVGNAKAAKASREKGFTFANGILTLFRGPLSGTEYPDGMTLTIPLDGFETPEKAIFDFGVKYKQKDTDPPRFEFDLMQFAQNLKNGKVSL